MNSNIAVIALAGLLLLAACGKEPPERLDMEGAHFTDPEEQRRFKEELAKAGIPFEIRDQGDTEQIRYESRFSEDVRELRDRLFGAPPPIGRNVALGEPRMSMLEKELRKRGAVYRKGLYHGNEYIAWDPESDEAADEALQAVSVHPELFEEMQRMRRLTDAESDLTMRSRATRETRAP